MPHDPKTGAWVGPEPDPSASTSAKGSPLLWRNPWFKTGRGISFVIAVGLALLLVTIRLFPIGTTSTPAGPSVQIGAPGTHLPKRAISLQRFSGHTAYVGRKFRVPRWASEWDVQWSYDCRAHPDVPRTFKTYVRVWPHSSTLSESGENLHDPWAKGDDSYFDTGVFSIKVSSLCPWTAEVVIPSA